jgi:ABC-type bacteriocin/lantibiotic exporter with double-glycine peptidase domain
VKSALLIGYSATMASLIPSSLKFAEIKKVLLLLDKKDRFKLFLVLMINTFLAFLDLLGVALIGITSAILIRGLQGLAAGDQVNRFLALLNLDGLPQRNLLILLGGSAIFFFVLKTILSVYFLRRTLRYMSIRNAQISSSLVSKMLNRPVEKIFSKSIQHQIYNVNVGVERLIGGAVTNLVIISSDLVLLLVILVGLMLVDPITSVGTFFVFAAIAFLLYFLLHKRVAILNTKTAYQTIYFSQKISEGINSFRDLFIKGGREFYVNEIRKTKMQLAGYDAEIKFIPNISKYTIEISVILGIALIAGIQFYLFDSNRAIAVISVFLAASTRIAPAIIRLQQNVIAVKSSLSAAKPTFELIDELNGVEELSKTETVINTNHANFLPRISLSKLKFTYSDTVDDTIQNISLDIAEGKFIAFVGPSGGGKSTLVDLILGLLAPSSGSIQISGLQPVDAIKKWPGSIGYVPQDVFVENSTVKENICLGFNPDSVKDDLVWQALQMADLSDFVKGLEGQLSYRISDAGKNLSGGQRQRLGIARALLTKPKIVIFDEATSALDAETENRVSESILKLTGECTVIFIAHRLSVVRSADMIYYIDKGKIVSQGSFEELRKLNADFNNQANFMGI